MMPPPGMCFPIQYAVTWPERVPNTLPPLDFATLGKLEFEPPRRADFPALDLARWAGEAGGTLPGVLNAANEVAVARFLEGRIAFGAIPRIIERTLVAHRASNVDTVGGIRRVDEWARRSAAAASGAVELKV